MNEQDLERRVRQISDEDLFAALDLARPELHELSAAAQRRDYSTAYRAWTNYWPTVAERGLMRDAHGLLVTRQEAQTSLEPARETILAEAEQVLHHRIRGWGEVTIDHGPAVDFNADYGKSAKYGFHYWTFAEPLLQAYLLTGEQRYVEEFDALFERWYEQRHHVTGAWPHLDVIYNEMGLAMRLRPFLEAYFLPLPRSPRLHERMLKTLLASARWLHGHASERGYEPGNVQTVGCSSLLQVGLLLPEFKESPQWAKSASTRLIEHAKQDFFPDGCHCERCPSDYMLVCCRALANAARVLPEDAPRRELAEVLHGTLRRAGQFYRQTIPPDGLLPAINDGARALPLPPRAFGDGGGVESASVHLPPSGFTAMRSDASPDARYLLINHGPSGGGHSHADALSFQLHAYGQALAVDAGIGATYDDPLWSTWYVRAKAHNALTVDGDDPDRAAAEGRGVAWTSTDRFDHFAATHHGYATSKQILHRRHVVFVKPDYFLVYDVIEAAADAGAHALEWNLHLTVPPDVTDGPGLIVQPAAARTWSRRDGHGWASVLGIRGFSGRRWAEIDWLRFTSSIRGGEIRTVGMLLYPFAGPRPPVRFDLLEQRGRAATFLVAASGRADRIVIAEGAAEVTQT